MVSLGSVILKPYLVKRAELSLFVKSASECRERARSESLKIFIGWVSVSLNEREVVPTEWILSPVAAVIHRGGFEVTGEGRYFISDSLYEESEQPPSRIGTWCA